LQLPWPLLLPLPWLSSSLPLLLPLSVPLFVIPQGSAVAVVVAVAIAVAVAYFPPSKQTNRHFDRSCSRTCEQRSGETPFSTQTVTQPSPVSCQPPNRQNPLPNNNIHLAYQLSLSATLNTEHKESPGKPSRLSPLE
jgi:hypothetical protein